MSDDFTQGQAAVLAEKVVVDVVRADVSSTALRTAALAKARLNSYVLISENYNRFIEHQSRQLSEGLFAEKSGKELGVARLIFMWLVESEKFFAESKDFLGDAPKTARKGFIDESFETLPENKRNDILAWFNEQKQNLLVALVQRVQIARSESDMGG
jgi:hypothetical protein